MELKEVNIEGLTIEDVLRLLNNVLLEKYSLLKKMNYNSDLDILYDLEESDKLEQKLRKILIKLINRKLKKV